MSDEVGIHISNRMHRMLWRMMEIPWGCATILDLNCFEGYSHPRTDGSMGDYEQDGHRWSIAEAWRKGIGAPGWRPTPPHDGILHVRYYRKNWMSSDPISWARGAATQYHRRMTANGPRICDITKHVSLWCEPNLAAEAGGGSTDDIADGDRCAHSKAAYTRFNTWACACLDEFRRLCPDAVLHFGAFAFGHSDDRDDNGDGTIGIGICADAIGRCDIVDHHPYWDRADRLFGHEAEWYAFRFTRAARQVHLIRPHMPIFLSECGWKGHHQDAEAADHFAFYFRALRKYPYVLGATPFIWDSGPEHAGQLIWRNPTLVDQLRLLASEVVPPPPPPLERRVAQLEEAIDRLGGIVGQLADVIRRWKALVERLEEDV